MPQVDTSFPTLRARHQRLTRDALITVFTGQAEDVAARFDAGAATLLAQAWDARLQSVVYGRNRDTAREIGQRVADAFHQGRSEVRQFDPDLMEPWLDENARIAAEQINTSTRDSLADAEDATGIGDVFDTLLTAGAAMYATSMVTSAASFAGNDAARSSGATSKMWQTTSANPRLSHALLNGVTVPIGQSFPNGMAWPGDPVGGADEVAGCQCSLAFL